MNAVFTEFGYNKLLNTIAEEFVLSQVIF